MNEFTKEELRVLYCLVNDKVCDMMMQHKTEISDNARTTLDIGIHWMKSLEKKIAIEFQNRNRKAKQ